MGPRTAQLIFERYERDLFRFLASCREVMTIELSDRQRQVLADMCGGDAPSNAMLYARNFQDADDKINELFDI